MPVTLQDIETKQDELLALINEFKQQPSPVAQVELHIQAATIVLRPGEWYAGAVLNEDGSIKHHTVVAAVHSGDLDYADTQEWAQGLGLSAPTIQESRLIVAHKYGRLAGMSWIWTCEPHSNAAYAWHCNLGGIVYDGYRSAQGGAVAVRRFNP